MYELSAILYPMLKCLRVLESDSGKMAALYACLIYVSYSLPGLSLYAEQKIWARGRLLYR